MKSIGVYKTDVDNVSEARMLLEEIRCTLPGSDPSFDLDDCDNVLRIEYESPSTNHKKIAVIFERLGYELEPLL